MSQGVELYGQRLAEIPVIGEAIDSEEFLCAAANALSVARGLAGPAIAGYILSNSPEDRTYAMGFAVAAIGASDRLDGDMIRALKLSMSEGELEEYQASGRADLGAKIDHLADKAFVIPPMGALAVRGEISPVHPMAKVGRDFAVGKVKARLAELGGGYRSASELARIKATAEMMGVSVGASPLAAKTGPDGETTWTEYIFRAATVLSLETGRQYVMDLQEAVINHRIADVEQIVLGGASSYEANS